MPSFAFPPAGSLGLSSPPSTVLFSATTAARSFLLAWIHHPCSKIPVTSRFLLSSFTARNPTERLRIAPGLNLFTGYTLVSGVSLAGNGRLSQVPEFPLNTCHVPGPRWYLVNLPLTFTRLLPSILRTGSAFPLNGVIHNGPRSGFFRGSIARPIFSLRLASDSRYRVYP